MLVGVFKFFDFFEFSAAILDKGLLKQCTNLILRDKNYTSFVVSLLVHKMGGGEGALIRGGVLI